MAGVGFEEFSAPPGSELALPPLFGGNILESELDTEVNERVLGRLQQVQRITRRLQQERRFLMKVLDSYGDEYRQGQLTFLLEDEGSGSADAPTPGNAENEPPTRNPPRPPAPPGPPDPPSTKRRRRQ
ncbi:TCF3 fusion partner, partial [Anser cygnoides]|uniref:TCF3 fusion partner homolog n=1 Tax=Anser cygnoides TaxID=8845 RepID=UPI0034D159D2